MLDHQLGPLRALGFGGFDLDAPATRSTRSARSTSTRAAPATRAAVDPPVCSRPCTVCRRRSARASPATRHLQLGAARERITSPSHVHVQPGHEHDRRPPRAGARRLARAREQRGRLRPGGLRGDPRPPAAGGQPALERLRLPGARGRQPAGRTGQPLRRRRSCSSVPSRQALSFWNRRASPPVARGYRAPRASRTWARWAYADPAGDLRQPAVPGLNGFAVGNTSSPNAVHRAAESRSCQPERSLTYEGSLAIARAGSTTKSPCSSNEIDGNIRSRPSSCLRARCVTLGGGIGWRGNRERRRVRAAERDRARPDQRQARRRPPTGASARWTCAWAQDWRASTVFRLPPRPRTRTPSCTPNIEGGTPASDGWLKVRWSPPAGASGWSPYLHVAARQDRISTLDLGDRRTGGARTVRVFATSSTTARATAAWSATGATVLPTADDVLPATGETVQITSRVLGSPTVAGDRDSRIRDLQPARAGFGSRPGTTSWSTSRT